MSFAQEWTFAIAGNCAKVDSVKAYLKELEALGVKELGSQELDDTRDWIVNKYASFGYSASLDSFIFSGKNAQNIIIEKAGSSANDWVVLSAHYDTKNGAGVNDNGTGVVACMQIAKILKDVPTEYGIRIIHFAAEENGLIGSKFYVANTLSSSDNLRLVFNLDQLGGSLNQDNSKIVCERDENNSPVTNNDASWKATDTLASLVQLYTTLTPVISNAYGSDYIPFEDSGYVITGFYQESNDPHNHSANDLLSNLDTTATEQVIKAALAATMHFAKHQLPVSVPEIEILNEVAIYPNPSQGETNVLNKGHLYLQVSVINGLGQTVEQHSLKPHSNWTISELPNGVYSVVIFNNANQQRQNTKLIFAR